MSKNTEIAFWTIEQLRDENARLRARNAQLLAALEKIWGLSDTLLAGITIAANWTPEPSKAVEAMLQGIKTRAEAAIAAAEKGEAR